MKYILSTALALFLIGNAVNAQENIENKTSETITKKVTQGGEKLFESKVVIDQIQLLKFEESDANSYEKDIDLDGSPIKIVKTVWIDNDMDNRYDKMIRLSYDKKFGEDVTFDTIADGLVFTDDQGRTMMVRDYGFYVMNSGEDNEVIITVDRSIETY